MTESKIIEKITRAIEEETGTKFEYYAKNNKDLYPYYLRLIFIHYCEKEGVTRSRLATMLNRNISTIDRASLKYKDELLNKKFRIIANGVNEKLCKN